MVTMTKTSTLFVLQCYFFFYWISAVFVPYVNPDSNRFEWLFFWATPLLTSLSFDTFKFWKPQLTDLTSFDPYLLLCGGSEQEMKPLVLTLSVVLFFFWKWTFQFQVQIVPSMNFIQPWVFFIIYNLLKDVTFGHFNLILQCPAEIFNLSGGRIRETNAVFRYYFWD